MGKKRSSQEIFYPIPKDFSLTDRKPILNQEIVKRIIRSTVRGAYRLSEPFLKDQIKPLASPEQMELVISLIEALNPTDAIEAALASQFTLSYIRGLQISQEGSGFVGFISLFEFSHQVLEAYQKYRSKGAQQISVQYNVNQGQVVNIKTRNGELM